jgi:hypothetical protein
VHDTLEAEHHITPALSGTSPPGTTGVQHGDSGATAADPAAAAGSALLALAAAGDGDAAVVVPTSSVATPLQPQATLHKVTFSPGPSTWQKYKGGKVIVLSVATTFNDNDPTAKLQAYLQKVSCRASSKSLHSHMPILIQVKDTCNTYGNHGADATSTDTAVVLADCSHVHANAVLGGVTAEEARIAATRAAIELCDGDKHQYRKVANAAGFSVLFQSDLCKYPNYNVVRHEVVTCHDRFPGLAASLTQCAHKLAGERVPLTISEDYLPACKRDLFEMTTMCLYLLENGSQPPSDTVTRPVRTAEQLCVRRDSDPSVFLFYVGPHPQFVVDFTLAAHPDWKRLDPASPQPKMRTSSPRDLANVNNHDPLCDNRKGM